VAALAEAGVGIEDARVAVLGYAYLENSDDIRNSPSIALINRLEELGAHVIVHDPWVREYQGNLRECLSGCDAIVVMVRHQEYLAADWQNLGQLLRHRVLVDGRRIVVDPDQLPGFVFRGIGRAAL
jgi:UDP-N-acetyl-D-mannosaminuronic acid dehydrogenase